MIYTGVYTYFKYLLKISIRIVVWNKKIFFILIFIIAILFLSLSLILQIHSLLIEQISRSNIGHVQIYNKKYFSSSPFVRGEIKIENYKEVIHALFADTVLKDKVSDYSAQIEFIGIITDTTTNKSIVFSGLGIQPESSIKIGSYDITTLGSDLSSLDDEGIIVDDEIFQYLNLNYQSPVSVAIVNSTGELKTFSYKIRGKFKTELNSTNYNVVKFPLATALKILKSDGVNHINILLKKESDINMVINKINDISNKNNFNVESVSYFWFPFYLKNKLYKINYLYYFVCFLIVFVAIFFLNSIYCEVYNKIKKDIRWLNVFHLSYSKLFVGLIVFSAFVVFFLSLFSVAFGFLFLCILKIDDIYSFFYFLDCDLFFTIPVLLIISSVIILLRLTIHYVKCSDIGVCND